MIKKALNIIKAGKSIFIVYIILAGIIISSALVELNQSKQELLDLMRFQSHSLLDIIIQNSKTALKSMDELEDEITERLLNNAIFIKYLQKHRLLNNTELNKIALQNRIYRINIISDRGVKVFSSHKEIHSDLKPKHSPLDFLNPIFSGKTDTLIIGFKQARFKNESRFAVAIKGMNNTAIVLNLDAEQILKFKQQIGLGRTLRQVAQNEMVLYAALQDKYGVIAGAGQLNNLEPIDSSSFLISALKDATFKSRIQESNDSEWFEVVHPYELDGQIIAVFRLGLSLKSFENINARIVRRLAVIGIILFLLGSLALSFVYVRQNYRTLEKQYKSIEAYAYKILKSVDEGIIVCDSNFNIKLFNDASTKLLGNKISNESKITESLPAEYESYILQEDSCTKEINIKNNGKRVLLCSKSKFVDEDEINYIFVFRDITEAKEIEAQKNRQGKLAAMGELASGVAHEIRNPLNTIATIAQQLKLDFEPSEDKEQFKKLTALIYSEVKRINKTIEEFLRFARPVPLNLKEFLFEDFISSVKQQYDSYIKQKNISFELINEYKGNVYWDPEQMRQVFSNLIQNAFDAIDDNGKINIVCKNRDSVLIITITDNGSGMDEESLKKIFNLYYTTKATGTGIGLAVVQRIISDHNGVITVESVKGEGTEFTLKIPIRANKPETKNE